MNKKKSLNQRFFENFNSAYQKVMAFFLLLIPILVGLIILAAVIGSLLTLLK